MNNYDSDNGSNKNNDDTFLRKIHPVISFYGLTWHVSQGCLYQGRARWSGSFRQKQDSQTYRNYDDNNDDNNDNNNNNDDDNDDNNNNNDDDDDTLSEQVSFHDYK